ncbi:DUF4190 domain-containing protein [Rhodococcus sp. NPDC049939]|uniref:DUF4190 domain-containing protein n=1 Tax=Rhodococcus sp. NPDC049939 TaxID=3155511 RepID=UPI00340C48AE
MTSANATTPAVDTRQPIPEKTNTAAMIGLFSALVGLAPVAIVFGIMGVRETARRPNESGGGAAQAAIILGLFEIGILLIIALAQARS